MPKHYDAVIIGAGLAGLSAAALLATEEKRKVLVLEKEDYVGGRLVSFAAENGTLKLHGKSLDHKKFKKVMASVYAWVARSEPDMETMLKEKLLDGYSFEAGGHATFWGTKGRVGFLLGYLDKAVPLPGNEGFSVVDPEEYKLFPMEKGGNYGWSAMEASNPVLPATATDLAPITAAHSADNVGERIGCVLHDSGFPASYRELDNGVQLQETKFKRYLDTQKKISMHYQR